MNKRRQGERREKIPARYRHTDRKTLALFLFFQVGIPLIVLGIIGYYFLVAHK
jgi:hypothetical protein